MARRMRIGYSEPGTFRLIADTANYVITGQTSTNLDYSGLSTSGNDGFIVTDGRTYNSATAQVQSIDVNSVMPTRISGNASVTYATETWWNGTATVGTFKPATNISDTYCGFGGFGTWNNATRVVRQINVRWEFKLSDQHLIAPLGPPGGPGGGTALPKWLIINTRRELTTNDAALSDRPMLFLARMNEADSNSNQVANALTSVVAQDTVRCFAATNQVPAPNYDASGTTGYQNQLVQCIRATGGTTTNGQPIVDNDEYMCVEVRVNVMGTSDEPNGVIAHRIYRRSSTAAVFERATAWTNTPNESGERPIINTNYIEGIDVGGGGYYNDPSPAGDTQKWTKIGRRITIATNYQPTLGRAWLGPPEGFVI